MTAAKYLLPPSVVAEHIDAAARLAALLDAVAEMESSAAHFGNPKPETLSRVFQTARAISDYRITEMS